jgi:hypothetical protein
MRGHTITNEKLTPRRKGRQAYLCAFASLRELSLGGKNE